MHLKEIVIDGFKSYATRTIVPDFDPAFNAITGLNGSGKSNVLDSICFVLGISNLTHVRVAKLDDLVYKSGLAGVSKATVSLIFNNADKSIAPVGYEQPDEITVTRQIVIGGRNRYLINGVNAQQKRVENFFHSVGLNVNNPHFLIMQGRITKVINMKPPEVLSMIEEAAGTKMYENKKEKALRTMEKKQRKVDEINSLLEDKINPSLAKLELERKHYIEWNQNNNDIETLRRYLIAFRYFQATQILERSSGQRSELHKRITDIEKNLEQLGEQQPSSKSKLDTLLKGHSNMENSCDLEDNQFRVETLGKELVKLKSAWVNQQSSLKKEEESLQDLECNLTEQTNKATTLKEELKSAEADIHPAEENHQKASNDLENAETAILTGASSQDAHGAAVGTGSLIDQLEASRRTFSSVQTTKESLLQRQAHLQTEYQDKSAELARDRANVRKIDERKRAAEKAVADAKVAVHELDFDPASAEQLNAQLHDEKRHVAEFSERFDSLSARLESCDFRYTDPHPNFDRSKVHGLVAKLINVKDSRMTTAIEVTAGGRLFQVVVDSDGTANDLLKRGRLVRRVTILPLNKIRHDVLARGKLQCAKQIEPSTELALSLVGYDREVTNAVEHVFGRTLVCPDMDSAKRVTFDNRVRTRTVTMEGDSYDPSGTLSGGSSNKHGPSTLALLGELRDSEAKLTIHRSNVERLSAQVAAMNDTGRYFRQLKASLEVREEEMRLLAQQLEETSTGRLMAEVKALEQLNEEIKIGLQKAKDGMKEEKKKITELERVMEDSGAAKEREKEQAETAMATVRTAHETAVKELQNAKDKHSTLTVDLEAIEEELKRLQEELEGTKIPAVAKLRIDVQTAEEKVGKLKDALDSEEADLKKEKERISSSNQNVSRARKVYEDILETVESFSLEKAKLDSKLRDIERGRSGAEKLVQDLDRKHVWISQECEVFGTTGSDYEFNEERNGNSKKKLEKLEQRQENLSKRINKKAMHMFETAKEEYKNLMKKKAITEQDKEKIEMVITGLDQKKMVAVERTWRKVNEDFGNIFSDLLPGTSAKLEPPEGGTVDDGLEIRVAFGGVWKDSLSELSGGQRSLIALSLILAMLRFKPAPMYILDEVDAALDLSHTQNIGRMLRKHFSGSQFIVVSLKEGMFGNANVIFRTKFVEGVSTIKRSQNSVNIDDDQDGRGRTSGVGAGRAPSFPSMSQVTTAEQVKENIPDEYERPSTKSTKPRKRRAVF